MFRRIMKALQHQFRAAHIDPVIRKRIYQVHEAILNCPCVDAAPQLPLRLSASRASGAPQHRKEICRWDLAMRARVVIAITLSPHRG